MGIGFAGTSGSNVAPALTLNQNPFFEIASYKVFHIKSSGSGWSRSSL